MVDSSSESRILSDEDKTISSLKAVIADVDEQIAHLSARVTALSDKAREALQSKNRILALAALRSKRLNETTLTQRSETLARLEEVYNKIEQASDQATILHVMKTSTAVLRQLHTAIGGVSKIEDVVEGLREEMTRVDEVSSTLEAGGQGDDIIDQNAVDEELESMERQAKMEEEKAQALDTQKRLAAIDNADDAIENGFEQLKTTEAPELPMEHDIKAMKRLSLESQKIPGGDTIDVSKVSAEVLENVGSTN